MLCLVYLLGNFHRQNRPITPTNSLLNDDVIKWKHFPRNWQFVRRIHRSPVNSPHKGQWRGALMFSLIYVWINDWVNNREAGDLRRYRAHYAVIVMRRGKQRRFYFDPNLTWWAYQAISLLSRPGTLSAGGLISPLFSPAFDDTFDQLQLIGATLIFKMQKDW